MLASMLGETTAAVEHVVLQSLMEEVCLELGVCAGTRLSRVDEVNVIEWVDEIRELATGLRVGDIDIVTAEAGPIQIAGYVCQLPRL